MQEFPKRNIREVWVLQSFLSRDAFVGIVGQHFGHQIEPILCKVRQSGPEQIIGL